VEDEEEEDMDEGEEDNIAEITAEEIKSALQRMKNGRATGEDGLPAEVFKAAGPEGVRLLKTVFNIAFRDEVVPDDWLNAIIYPIWKKKGMRTDCNNHRGIALLSHAGKIYERIIEQRIRRNVEDKLGDWQYGYRPGMGTTDLIFTLKMILEKNWEWANDKFIAFIDMEKAFDRINRNNLWKVMREDHYGIDPKLIRVVKSIHRFTRNKVKCGEVESEWFEVRTGVRQGGVLSPLLFIIYMDKCLRDICGNDEQTETLVYADDAAVITDSEESLRRVLERWYTGLTNNGMKMNTKKTEIMHVGRNVVHLDIVVGDRQLKQVNNFTYLGVNINNENIQETEINNRINEYNANVCMLYPILKDRNVPIQCKIIIFNSILKPILTDGSESWALTMKTQSKLQAAEMRMLRLIRGVTRRDRLRNTQIRRDLGVPSMLEDLEKKKLRWYGHVKRMDNNRHARRYLEWVPNGRRPVGRPRKRWTDGIKKSLEDRGTSLEEVDEGGLCQDRTLWRGLIQRPFD
jgi:hypothetical protein